MNEAINKLNLRREQNRQEDLAAAGTEVAGK